MSARLVSQALPAGSFSAVQAARSARALASSLGLVCSVRVGPSSFAMSFVSPSHASAFEGWLGECVFSSGAIRQCLGFASVLVAGSFIRVSGW